MINLAKIKLVIWDLDDTLWEGTLSDNGEVKIRTAFLNFVQDSLDRGIVHSICSKNDYDVVKQFLLSQNLWNLFVFPSINWDAKGARIRKIISDMKLRAENVLFVDDNLSNLNEAKYYCKDITVSTPEELLCVVSTISKIGTVDQSRPRLAQYRILEEKTNAQQEFTSNEAFLTSCNIRVNFHYDCLENAERIHELIMRSNQLNYTKFRQDMPSLIEDLSSPNTNAAYITVRDDFGDYGIVGFYMLIDGIVKHFLFSCRTLGMLVEQYVYMELGCPKFHVAGEVITKLDEHTRPKWINQASENVSTNRNRENVGELKLLFKGPCDISQIFSFIEQTDTITTEFTYIRDDGMSVEGYNHTSQLVTSILAPINDKTTLINDTAWLDAKMFDATAWMENDAIVFSLLTDGNLGVYQHRQTGWQIALCEKFYDLTNPSNWNAYINKEIFTSNINFTEQMLRDFAEKYQYVNNDNGDVTISNLDTLYNAKKDSAKLILVLGSEIAYDGPTSASYENRHLFHRNLNKRVIAWSEGKKNVHLIQISNYITSQNDYTDTINHFQKQIYYRMAKDLFALLNNDTYDVKIKNKFFLYWVTIKQKLKKIISKMR